MTEHRFSIPNCLNRAPQDAEELIGLTADCSQHAPMILDMRHIDFINPYGALLLLATSRCIKQNSGYRVKFESLQYKVHAYLERMDFFSEGSEWLYTDDVPTDTFLRSPASSQLLEITRLTTTAVRTRFQGRTRKVLGTWLPARSNELNEIVTVLSEICGNAEEHSQDQGHAMIQSYRHQSHTEIDIVVIDLGIGINGSLREHYQHVANDDIDYIKLSLSGHSARGKQMGGAGLQIVQKHVAKRNGELAIRSGCGLVVVEAKGTQRSIVTHDFPGTQVSLKLRGYKDLT